jgi:sugar O-acyltransferase (sialic acid O-acetyltransferase NeuD family)
VKKIVILGTGGNCIDILNTLHDINEARSETVYRCTGFLDDDAEKLGKQIHGVPVLGPLSMAKNLDDTSFVFGIGSVSNFWRRDEILARTGIEDDDRFETVIHPTASISRTALVGTGAVIFQHVTITSDVLVGRHVQILPNAVVSHHDDIGDFTCVAGGVCISGNVHIGQGCYLGANSSIINGIVVEQHCLVGMGSVVLRNVPSNSVVAGNPARFIRQTRTC